MENESEASKNSVDQIFTGENRKASLIFYLFRSLRIFSMEFFLVYGSIFWFCCHTYLKKYLRSCPWLVYIGSFHLVMVIHTYFCTKGYDYDQCFVHILVLLVINTGCPQKLLKMGNTALLISSSNYGKTPHKCVHKRQFVLLVFWQFF